MALRSMLVLSLFGAVSAGTVEVSVTDCCKGANPPCKASIASLDYPKEAQTPGEIKSSGQGTLQVATSAPTMELTIEMGGAKILDKTVSACGEIKIPLPLGLGSVDVTAITCPAQPGPVTVNIDIVNKIALPAPIKSHSVTKHENGDTLLCLDINLTPKNELTDAAPAITEALVKEINAKQRSWVSHVSPRFANASVGDVKTLCGTILKGDARYSDALEEKGDDAAWGDEGSIPAEFDVRTQWPKCASVSGDIRDQSSCGSCWAFGSTEAFNDRRCIATGDTTLLSPEDTVGNCGFLQCMSMGCNGGQPGRAWKWFKSHGVVTGGDYSDIGKGDTCAPYSLAPCAHHVNASKYPACPSKEYPTPKIGSKCSEDGYGIAYAADKKKASAAYSLGSVQKIQQDMVQYGSATTAFTVYGDFPTYKSGVYHHVSGSKLGGHAVKFLGWGTESGEDYWLVANSWNNAWGDHGTFKIRRGTNECGIEGQVSAGTVSPSTTVVV